MLPSVPCCTCLAYNIIFCLTLQFTQPTQKQLQGTLNSVGLSLALAFMLPQLLLGWSQHDAALFAVPISMGWVMFDVSIAAGLLLEVWRCLHKED